MMHPSFLRFMTYINQQVIFINDDLEKISYWAYQWKMQFNADPNKQANEVIFSLKTSSNNLSHPPINFNNNDISNAPIKST